MSPFEQFSERITPTRLFNSLGDFIPFPESAYVYGSSDESRTSYLSPHLAETGIALVFLEDGESNTFSLTLGHNSYSIGLNHGRAQDSIWDLIAKPLIYIDITGLPHHIWAPLIVSASRVGQNIQVLYVEPSDYSRSQNPTQLYDLSDEYTGIKGLPGFAMLQPTSDDVCYIPLLGFEGARFSLATNEVQPPINRTFPIIGLPGFRPEYPFEAYIANQLPLESDSGLILPKIIYTDASCPFALYYALDDIATSHRNDILKIALLGTKPHALGAALYAMNNKSNRVQLIYDYPKRKIGRTIGSGRIYLYHVTFFLSSLVNID